MIKLLKRRFLFQSDMVKNKASILVVSIWMLLIFSIFAVGLSRICTAQINVAKRLQASSLSFSVMLGLCNLLQWELTKDLSSYDTLHGLGGERTEETDSVKVIYTVIDEESKININTMPQKVIKRLPGVDDDIAVEITTSSLRPYAIKEELLLLESLDDEILAQISPFITVKSNGKVNINTASKEVLVCLGLEDDLADTIISFRDGPDGLAASLDDQIFKNKSEIIGVLRDFEALSASWEQQLVVALGWLDVGGEIFSLIAETEVLDRKAFEYDIIIAKDKILRWKEK